MQYYCFTGLNERSWDKYLSWAYTLAAETGKSVILFPIAFHMNRSPEAWHDQRQMSRFVDARKKSNTENENLSFANIAISERLTYAPETFFLSGYQSAKDIYYLTREIKAGNHALFHQNAHIDFFGYSFGAFLEEILLISNPENFYSDSKFSFSVVAAYFPNLMVRQNTSWINGLLNAYAIFISMKWILNCEEAPCFRNC
jgi:hypothetical protein